MVNLMGKIINFEDRLVYEALIKKLQDNNIAYDKELLINNNELVKELLLIVNYCTENLKND